MEKRIEDINFNELAWNSPKHGDLYGYVPGDKWYEEIISWLKKGKTLWRVDGEGKVIKRMNVGSPRYDVVAEWYPATKMVSWVFQKPGEYYV
jgi:hypothetical protein